MPRDEPTTPAPELWPHGGKATNPYTTQTCSNVEALSVYLLFFFLILTSSPK